MLAASGKLALVYAEKLLVGVKPEHFARLAAVLGVPVRSNHPAFIFGHLCLYPQRVLHVLGRPVGETTAPPEYDGLFKAGAECRDDPEARMYPPMDELTTRFFSGYRTAIAAAESAEDVLYTKPNPTEGRSRDLFPTIGAAVGFYLGGHVQNHLGQFSAWRRMIGLGPAA